MRILKKELWPYRVSINQPANQPTKKFDDTDVFNWLSEKIGTFQIDWNIVYNYDRTDIYFKLGKDATMFSLRWS